MVPGVRPVRFSDRATAVLPVPIVGLKISVVAPEVKSALPALYVNLAVVSAPFGVPVPLSVADVPATEDAATVVTVG